MTGRDVELVRVALGMDQDFFALLLCVEEEALARVEMHKAMDVFMGRQPARAILETLLSKSIEELKALGPHLRTALVDRGWVAGIALLWKGVPV